MITTIISYTYNEKRKEETPDHLKIMQKNILKKTSVCLTALFCGIGAFRRSSFGRKKV